MWAPVVDPAANPAANPHQVHAVLDVDAADAEVEQPVQFKKGTVLE